MLYFHLKSNKSYGLYKAVSNKDNHQVIYSYHDTYGLNNMFSDLPFVFRYFYQGRYIK